MASSTCAITQGIKAWAMVWILAWMAIPIIMALWLPLHKHTP